MADSGALRVQRHNRHKRGDHSLCRPDRCPDAPTDNGQEVEVRQPGGVEAAVTSLLGPLVAAWPADDPRVVMAGCAMRLAEAVDDPKTAAGSLPSLVRELGLVLTSATEGADQLPTKVEAIQAQRAVRRLKVLVGDEEAS